MSLAMAGLPVRIAEPVGPRPRSVSAHVMFRLAEYPSSYPFWATGRAWTPREGEPP
jgi:hypothetical protein